MAIIYNEGEMVFDQDTGEPFIDENGDLVEVSPNLIVNAEDGRSLSGDDVTNAAYYRANKWQGETLRDTAIGVPYSREVLGQSDPGLAMTTILAEVSTRTPGVAGVLDQQVSGFSPKDRVLKFRAILLKQSGEEILTDLVVT
jgi:hypothetical protein